MEVNFSSVLSSGSAVFGRETSASVAPTIVQMKGQKTSGSSQTITLDQAPTPGNTLYALASGFGDWRTALNTAWTLLGTFGPDSNQWISFAKRVVQVGDGTAWPIYWNNSPFSVIIIEVSGAVDEDCSAARATGASGTITSPLNYVANALCFHVVEYDQAYAYNGHTGPATLLLDGTSPSNHAGYYYQATAAGTLVTNIGGTPNWPVFGYLNIFGSGTRLNRTARFASGVTGTARTNRKVPVTKAYFEMIALDVTDTPRIGVANGSMDTATLLGANTNGIGYDKSGQVRINNVAVASLAAYTTNSIVSVAVDSGSRLIWFRVNGGNWNNSPTADPVTMTEGIDMSTMAIQSIIAAFGSTGQSSVQLLSGASELAFAPPTGYSTLEEAFATPRAVFVDPTDGVQPLKAIFRADLSGITRVREAGIVAPRLQPVKGAYYRNQYPWVPAGPHTTVSGVVQEEDVPVAGKKVHMYDSRTGRFLGSDVSDVNGEFSIPARGRLNVYVVALDPNYRALVYDRVVPG